MNTAEKEKVEMNAESTTNQRLVTALLILLIVLAALLIIGIVAGFLMMGGWMNGGMMNHMMSGYINNTAIVAPLTVDQAKAAAEKYLTNFNDPDLKIAEIMIFSNNAYVAVKEVTTGNGAFELLVDTASRAVFPEYGPNMMWNLKYGCLNHKYMMQSMMGGDYGMMGGMMANCATPTNVPAEMSVTPEQAIQDAQEFLDANISGATAATDPTRFYGYYTLDFEKNGKVAGMLSVNGFSGEVFLHTWHGTFIEESEFK